MLALVLKLTLAPALVAAATVLARHVGPRAAGLLSGLPVVAAPIVLVYAVEHGDRFAHRAAVATVLGLCSLVAFCVVYAETARRRSRLSAMAAAWIAFAAMTLVLRPVDAPLGIAAAASLVAIAAAAWHLSRGARSAAAARRQRSLLGWRMAITAALVLLLTGAAGHLSPHVAGLLVPVPIITAVMAGFTHGQSGAAAAIELLGGLVLALFSFLAFFVALAALLPATGGPEAFTIATAASLASWGALVGVRSRRR